MSAAAAQGLPSDWQAGFLAVLPAVQTHAQIQFRRLPAARREEAVQEAVAAACLNYQLAAARGKLAVVRPATLADFAVRHVRTGRHVGGRQDAAKGPVARVPAAAGRAGRQLRRAAARPQRRGRVAAGGGRRPPGQRPGRGLLPRRLRGLAEDPGGTGPAGHRRVRGRRRHGVRVPRPAAGGGRRAAGGGRGSVFSLPVRRLKGGGRGPSRAIGPVGGG